MSTSHTHEGNPTVAQYAIQRLSDLGIKHIFGVPGDYSFPFDNAIEANPHVQWIGNANELNAAYAADGYARIYGAAALSTTYAVGELSALNGVMGSRAEKLPVFHLVGQPSTKIEHAGLITHHTLGDGVYDRFRKISGHSTVTQTNLTPENAIAEMERVITEALQKRGPAYIGVAQDLALQPIVGTPIRTPVDIHTINVHSDPQALKSAVDEIAEAINTADNPIVLPTNIFKRYGIQSELKDFFDKTHLPYASMPFDKATIDETTPGYIGVYNGDFSTPGVAERIETADVVLDLGGVVFEDFNTGHWSDSLALDNVLCVHTDYIRIGPHYYGPVNIVDVVRELMTRITPHEPKPQIDSKTVHTDTLTDKLISSAAFPLIEKFIEPGDNLFIETGEITPFTLQFKLPEDTSYQSQTLWGSIGWATGAVLGGALANPDQRAILITGDGSFQLTANDLGTIKRHGANPIMIIVNNQTYAIEEVLEPNQGHEYNKLVNWQYSKLPEVLGASGWYTAQVHSTEELAEALKKARAHTSAGSLIEIVTGPHDIRESLPEDTLRRLYKTH